MHTDSDEEFTQPIKKGKGKKAIKRPIPPSDQSGKPVYLCNRYSRYLPTRHYYNCVPDLGV